VFFHHRDFYVGAEIWPVAMPADLRPAHTSVSSDGVALPDTPSQSVPRCDGIDLWFFGTRRRAAGSVMMPVARRVYVAAATWDARLRPVMAVASRGC
jgi:hypothetical protein